MGTTWLGKSRFLRHDGQGFLSRVLPQHVPFERFFYMQDTGALLGRWLFQSVAGTNSFCEDCRVGCGASEKWYEKLGTVGKRRSVRKAGAFS